MVCEIVIINIPRQKMTYKTKRKSDVKRHENNTKYGKQ